MRPHFVKASLKTALFAVTILFLGASSVFAQQQVNLTVGPTSLTMPDGSIVPMWGYFCGSAVSGSTATCAASNPGAVRPTYWAAITVYTQGQLVVDSNQNVQVATTGGTSGANAPTTWGTTAGATTTDGNVTWTYQSSLGQFYATATNWSPVLITVPTGQGLTINLTNNLTFLGGANNIPTSIVIVGQVGGGLGGTRTTKPSPSHTDAQGCPSWFIASPNTPPGAPCTTSAPLASPPAQGPRVQSMATEVAVGTSSTALTWSGLKPGTYLLESGTHPSIQVPMGLIGMLVVTQAPSGGASAPPTLAKPGIAYPAVGSAPAVLYNAEVPFEFSEIDPVQNAAVDLAVRTVGFNETTVWSGMTGSVVTGLTLTSGGSLYTTPPNVTIAGGGGSGATATAAIGFAIANVSVTSGGTGYAVNDTIGWTDGGGTGAVVTVATIGAGGSILTVNLTNAGSGYTAAPTVLKTLSGTGSGAVLAATLAPTGSVTSLTLTSIGAGYTSTPSVTITGNALATATVVLPSCGQSHNCYPPAVNYTPFYYLINGVAFNKTAAAPSVFAATAGLDGAFSSPTPLLTPISGTVLVRLVNAGLRMHVPSIVGSLTQGFSGSGASATVDGFTLIAEDGNVVPGVAPAGATTAAPVAPRVQTDVFMAAGKTYDVMVNVPVIPPSGVTPALPIYDRQLSLSGNSSERDAGMLAYISVNNSTPSAGLPVQQGSGVFAAAQAVNDTYSSLVAGQPFTVSDPAKGVIANDINVYGVELFTPPVNGKVSCGLPGSPASGTICANGTFAYVPNANGISLSLTSGGANYSAPVVTISPPPSGGTTATATAVVGTVGVGMVTPTNPGSGYSTTPTVAFSGGGGTGAAATAVVTYGIGNVSGGMAYTAGDSLTFVGDTSGASATVNTVDSNGVILTSTVNNPGSGFSTPPTVTGGTGTGATATLTTTGSVTAITVTSSGSGYTTPPTVIITGASTTGATATASLNKSNAGVITAVNLTYAGSGYTTAPTVTITDGAGTGATTSVTVNAGYVASDTFVYEANGNPALTALVTLGGSTLAGNPTAINQTYTATTATYLKIPSPGLLSGNSDPNNLALSLVTANPPAGVVWDAQGGFTVSVGSHTTASTFTFSYTLQNSQGKTASAMVTVNFPTPSNLQVNVLDAQAYNNCAGNAGCINGLTPFPDYRWIIEEDKTFWIDPNCTTNSSASTPGCPGVATGGTIPTFGVNFHTSNMDFVAQGCTGPLSCEGGQTMLDTRPACTGPGVPAGCSATSGQHIPAVCDLGNGACRPDTTGNGFTPVLPGQVHLDPTKRYYISVLPGDAANPFPSNASAPNCNGVEATAGNTSCGHTMSGAPIPPACNVLVAGCTPTSTVAFQPVNVLSLPTPLPTGKLSVIVFEDDFPLNGEQDGGGGTDTVAPVEPGLGGFNIVLWDTYGGLGDVTGQNTYDMFNQPLSNSLAGTIDPATGLDACPISPLVTQNVTLGDGTQQGITGMIVTCPKYESDNQTLSPLAGQAVIANLMPEKFSVQAYPGADRIARGEEWIQTNTLDGQHPHDSFIRIGEPSYFQEYGPAGYHVSIGFANPAIINARHTDVCNGAYGTVGACTATITGQVGVARLSRTPDQRLYPSGSRDAFTWTQCWVSLGDPDAEDFMFTKCDANGNFKFTSVPGGNWRLTIGDQWNDQIIDGLSTPANVSPGQTLDMGNIGVQQWQANIYTRTFIDDNKNGIWDKGEIGIPLIYTMIHYRDGHNGNALTTDFNGVANFNETFPLFNWYVVEADSGRYKRTGTHTVYDAGGPADGSPSCGPGNGARQCGTSTAYNFLANTYEAVPLPTDLSVPGAVYCATADCAGEAASFAAGKAIPSLSTAQAGTSTGRIDPPWVWAEGWSGMTSQGNWIDFGMAPFASCPPACASYTPPGATTAAQAAENGGIHGIVVYASTRPFDSAQQMIQQPWEPNVPHVTVNLYQEGFAADGVTPTLTLVDTTQTSSWDDWAQGFYPNYTDSTSGTPKPYMSCPGQGTATNGTPNQDLFFFTLYGQPNYLDWYNSVHNGGTLHPLPYNSQYKCYDAMHIWNQLQPAPYDGRYFFPSSLGIDATSGKPLAVKGSTNGVSSKMNGTNCTVCVANPDTTDPYRSGTPMLPPGKYVVETIMPPGYEVYKEEDKNLLIGDNFIAPVNQQFAGLGVDIFILPDQASVASRYDQNAAGYNPNNFQNQTTDLGLQAGLSGVPGFPGFQDPNWPCVGEMRVVPDYLSLFPQNKEVAPFAGATRPLCDRKEVTLANQMSVSAKFFIYTSTHIASKFTGVITDDQTSEFDPFSPQFGEKFAPPNLSISTKDYLGNELSRVYSDHWGIYDGLTFSSWEVNPPNITGYSPAMMIQCMNDPGPIPGPNGQMITDPLYNPAYSDFCYEEPYMPGLTTYLDTPVVSTQAFVGAGYNNPDCSYPDTTPAIAEVDSPTDGLGPWVSVAGNTLTITALGDQQVTNSAYAGPSAVVAPFNQKTVTHHYGFGTWCTAVGSGCTAVSSVTIGGQTANITAWTDTQITVTVPNNVPACAIQQQAEYAPGATTAQCGQLVITAGNGKQSIDAVTVTVGGKKPTHVSAASSIQSAIDAAAPGDMIMVDPGSHTEMLIMWKPVRLQGVGATSSIVNANAHPSGQLLEPWRRHINCLFGLTLTGVPYTLSTGTAPYDPTGAYSCPDTGWMHFTAQPNVPQVDRLPLEATLGWDATLNGNLAEQLQEPSLMGAYEGAGITVLAKGLDFHGQVPWSDGTEGGAFPVGTTLLSGVGPDPTQLATGDASTYCHNSPTDPTNPFPSNFSCNPSSIDGLSVVNSSQGGGGIFVHGWAHYLQIANNRIYNNAGTLTGGISVGQGEFAPPYVQGGTTNAAPGSCSDGTGFVTNQHLPYCFQLEVNVHNNYITNNSSLGDELFSATLAGGGGTTFCTGNDYYKYNYNWVCGNVSAGEGGGVVHLGEIQSGDIEHNSFVFNQSTNPTIPTNGGGIQVMGTPDTDPVCGTQPDADCPPGVSDGTGHNLKINANLIQGNSADSGSGGGIRLQQVNGTEVSTFPTQPMYWNNVSVTNNIIVNNLAGWDGAGISLQDAMNVSIVNNTIVSNDTLASAGVLTQSIGTPMSSAPAGSCVQAGLTSSCPQSAGVTSTLTSPLLFTTFTGLTLTCPNGLPNCQSFSNPLLANNVIWQNRSFYIGVGNLGQGNLNQQKLVSLFSANGSVAPVQNAAGQCGTPANSSYWDIGVRGDKSPGPNTGSGYQLSPTYSVLDDPGYSAGPNFAISNPNFVSQYCNGSRVPPTCTLADGCGGPSGYGVPPGIVDASAPNPVFSLTPAATVDEGNNWINISWGPLALSDPSVMGGPKGNYGGAGPLGIYTPAPGSPLIDAIGSNSPTWALALQLAPTDFFGNPRPDTGTKQIDIGAVEIQNVAAPSASVAPTSVAFGNQLLHATVSATVTLSNGGNGPLTIGGIGVTPTGDFAETNNCPISPASLPASGSCQITITFTPSSMTAESASLGITSNDPANPTLTVPLTGTGAAPVAATAPTTLAFGNQFLGTTSAAQTVTLSNTGNFALSVASIALSDTTNYSQTNNCGSSVAAGSSCQISITFTPQAMGNLNPTLTITDNSNAVAGSTQTVSITGFGIQTIAGVSPASLTFGVDLINNATATQTVTLSNTGNWPLTIASIGLTGTNSNQFVTSGSTCGASLTAGNTCTINVAFLPTSTGAKTASLTFTDNSNGIPGSQQNVALTGTGVNTIVTPASLSFPATAVGGTSAFQTLTLRNVSGGPPKTIGITFSGAFARAGGSCGTALGNNGTCTINVVFKPTVPGSVTGSVAITLAGAAVGNSPVALSGTGIANPTLTSISPNTGVEGDTPVNVTLTGTNLTGATSINGLGGGISVTNLVVVNSTTITATFTIQGGAGAGPRNVTVTTTGGTSNAQTFTVVNPTDTSVSPNVGVRGTSVPVTITGTGLSTATGASLSGTGVTVTGFTAVNDTTITATFVISNTATLGALSVTVSTPSGNVTLANAFTVQGPTLASINPNTGMQGYTVPVVITGANLTGASAVNVSGGRVACTITGTPTATTVNANCVIAPNAQATARNVTVTTPIGTAGPVTFTVTTPPAPTLSSIAPNTGVRGTTGLGVTLTGTNFTPAGTTVSVSGFGVSVSGVTVGTSGTTITATFGIANNATLGALNVTVTTPGGTTTPPVTFTVQGPTVTAISPTTGARGTTVPVTLTGTNLTGATAVSAGGGVTCTGVAATSTTVTANCAISTGVTTGARSVSVTTPIGTATLTNGFTVTGATVTFSAPTPALNTGGTTTKNGTITVTNTATGSTAGPFTFTSNPTIAKTGGTGNGTFSIAGGGTCVSGLAVNPGSSCTIAVQYSGETNTAIANGRVTITGTGLTTPTLNSPTFPAN